MWMMQQRFRFLSSLPPPRAPPPKRDVIISLLRQRMEEFPTKDVVKFQDDRRHSIGRLHQNSRALGVGLSWTLHDNDSTVLMMVFNNIERLTMQFACLYAGCKIAMPEEYSLQEIDVAQSLLTVKPKSLWVTNAMVPNVRLVIPEINHQGDAVVPHPRNYGGSFNDGKPIASLDFPYLKHLFHTGFAREGRFTCLKHMLYYYPTTDPLESKKWKALKEEEPFLTVLTKKGLVKKQYSIQDIWKEAKKVQQQVQLKPDEAMLLATGGDPFTTLVGVVACMDTFAQCIVPGVRPESKQDLQNFLQVEKINCVMGGQVPPVLTSGKNRVAQV
jgi:acyl-CoA synthetase (AMP-forming)/AMP-acid ligase II